MQILSLVANISLSGCHMDLPGPTTSVGTRTNGGPLGLPGLRYTAPEGVEHKDCRGEVLG
jgi:hypothetical protein